MSFDDEIAKFAVFLEEVASYGLGNPFAIFQVLEERQIRNEMTAIALNKLQKLKALRH